MKPSRLGAAALLAGVTSLTHAQGIPVIDIANLVQAIQQVSSAITQIDNQLQQVEQLQSQIQATTGQRLMGQVHDDPALHNVIPADAYDALNAVNAAGYGGLSATAKALRDAGMVYNCQDLKGPQRTACQAALSQPYQQKGLLQDAMRAAAGRMAQIQALMADIDRTEDPKGVAEIQARIGAENAMLAHEVSQIQMLQGLSEAEHRIAESQERERRHQTLNRSVRMSNFLE